jgi:hypothetical protein
MYRRPKAHEMPNLAARIIGGMSLVQLVSFSAIIRKIAAMPHIAYETVREFLGVVICLRGAER